MKKTAIILQARMGSSRMPNKIMMPFYEGQTILEIIINKLKKIDDLEIIIATTVNKKDKEIVKFAKENSIACYCGSEEDVLLRFINAAEEFNINRIIRICSDNPFIDVKELDKLYHSSLLEDYDYISYKINGIPSILTHFGFYTEYVKLEALKRINRDSSEAIYHEHVTNYIYTHPNEFTIKWLESDKCLDGREDIRLTIDTIVDFNLSKKIYSEICNKTDIDIVDLVKHISLNPEYLAHMKEQIKLNNK